MSLRSHDLTTNVRVNFAPERARRPHEWKPAAELSAAPFASAEGCLFCPDNDDSSPGQILPE